MSARHISPLGAQSVVSNGAVVLLVLAWFAASRSGLPESIAPDPLRVIPLAGQLLMDPALAKHTYASLARVLVAVAFAVTLGTALMILARFFAITRALVARRLLPFLNAFPTVGWAILAVIWFGVNDVAVVTVIVAILLPFTMIPVWSGLLTLDEELYEMAKSFTRHRLRRLRLLVLPALLPEIVSSARVSYGVGWKVGIFAEIFGVTTGLGYLMNYARTIFDVGLVYASILAIVVLVVLVDRLVFLRLERRLVRHRADAALTAARIR